MNVSELNKAQLQELKSNYFSEKYGGISYGILDNIDFFVDDEEVFSEYADIDFVENDFFASADDKSARHTI